MKGFYIYESESRIGTEVDCLKIGYIDHIFTQQIDNATLSEEVKMHALISKGTKTKCSPDDTYDFETGALIALMKMCGVEKVVRAFNEVFPKEMYNTYITKFEGELCELKKEYDKVKDLKDFYKKNYEDVKEHYDKLGDRNKYLIEDINKKLEYIKEKDEENKSLKKSICAKEVINGKLFKDYNTAQNAYEVMVEKSADLMDKVKKLEEENKKLKSDKDKSWKNYQRNIQKKQDRINELNNIEEGYIKLREEYDSLFEEKEKLQHEYNLCLNSENALKCTVDSLNKSVDKLNKAIYGYKNDLYNTAKRCRELERAYKASNDDEAKLVEYYQREIKKFEEENEKLKGNINELFESDKYSKSLVGKLSFEKHRLEEENEKLKLDCEKLQHGYNDMIICGGRQNGKQYTLLVDLFKKLDRKKVDAAYKEAYNTTLPVWQKEFLNQMYGIYKESKEKIELPRTLDINGTVYRKSIQIKDFGEQINKLTVDSLIEQSRAFTRKCVDEWFYKIPTKREEMWGNILGATKCPPVDIKVAKQDITTFLRELQDKIPEVMWNGSDCPLTDYTNPYWFKHDYIYFALFRYDDTGKLKLCYSEEHHSWIKTTIDYLPPMRWDLFKKGRLVAKVSKENYAEFCSRVFSHFDKVGVHAFNHDCKFGYFMFNKDTDYVERILASDHGDAKEINRHKVIDWEDVR